MQVAVKAVGLNFKDVLNVLGMYSGDPGAPGGDCSGIVMQVGREVAHLQPGEDDFCVASTAAANALASCIYADTSTCTFLCAGDPVFGLAPGSLGHSLIAHSPMVVPKPCTLSFEAAATTPTVYIAALAAFADGHNIGSSTRLLVHAGVGGVGLAAINIARAFGCGVVATASSTSERNYLRRLGVQATADSRNVSFCEPTVSAMGPVDVVLNSLTSPGMIAASLSCLSQHGVFAEIGKRDVWSAHRLWQERPDVQHQSVAIDSLPPEVSVYANIMVKLFAAAL